VTSGLWSAGVSSLSRASLQVLPARLSRLHLVNEAPQEADEHLEEAAQSEGTRRRWYRRPWTALLRLWRAVLAFGLMRLVVMALGIAGFVLGIIVAWRADSAVALLVASVVLILVAILGVDWAEIRAAWGGAELLLRQSRDEAVLDAVTDSSSFDEFRARVERIEEQFAALEGWRSEEDVAREVARQLAARARVTRRPRPARTPEPSALAEALMSDASASHVITEDGVFLRLRMRGFGRIVSCDVVSPEGERRTAVANGQPDQHAVPQFFSGLWVYETVYPTAFGIEKLPPGPYLVEWKSKPTFQALARPSHVARDEFTIAGPSRWTGS
jgi:hypothetical protein